MHIFNNLFNQNSQNGDFTARYHQGYRFFQQRQYADALERFLSAAQLKPDDKCTQEMLACTYGNLQRWDESLQTLAQLEQNGHFCANCYRNKSVAYRGLGRFAEARQALEDALTLDAHHAQAWYELGLSWAKAWGDAQDDELSWEEQEKAAGCFIRATQLAPSNYYAWLSLGIAFSTMCQIAQVTQRLYAGAGLTQPKWPNYLQNSLAAFDKAIALALSDARAWAKKGELLMETDGYELQAAQVYTQLTELQPQDASTWYQLALARHQANRNQEVYPALSTALSLDPKLRAEARWDFAELTNDEAFKRLIE